MKKWLKNVGLSPVEVGIVESRTKYGYPFSLYRRINNMIKERIVWKAIEDFNKKYKRPVEKHELRERLEKSWVSIDAQEQYDICLALKEMGHLGDGAVHNGWGYTTKYSARNHYYLPRFLNKLADEVGFYKILSLVITILSFVPNGFAYHVFDRLFPPPTPDTVEQTISAPVVPFNAE